MTRREAELVVERLEQLLFEDGLLLDRFTTDEPVVALYYDLWETVDEIQEVGG